MIENIEKQLVPTTEATSPAPVGVETEVGGNAVASYLEKGVTSQPDTEQQTSGFVSPKLETTERTSPDRIVTTGDKWNEAIQDKEPGVAPIVL